MSYLIPLTRADHELAIFRPDATIETRKGLPVQIVWTQEGYQGFVILDKSKIFLTWDKLGQCNTFKDTLSNKTYDLFYRIREDKPAPNQQTPFNQMAFDVLDMFDTLLYCAVTVKQECQTNALYQFNLDKYMAGGYELETRNGFKIPALEFTGEEKKVIRGADNMRHLRWTRTGKINANGVEHELDLLMRKVRND